MNNRYEELIQNQKKYFRTGETKKLKVRKEQLNKLKRAILKHEDSIATALYKDLGKSEAEAVSTEIGMILNEINGVLKHLPKWHGKSRAKTNLFNLPGKSYTIR